MRKSRILVVDDRRSIVEVLRLFLQMRGYETREAYDGRSALELIRREPPDLVLLDLVIPERTGFEVLQAMRQDEQLSRIPVIVMTARSEVGELPTEDLQGASALLRKPFDLEEVAALVSKTLVQQPAAG
ncbi:MAG: response regulator [Bacillota bacterium]|nr:response regulator [Bacillota bacterium]